MKNGVLLINKPEGWTSRDVVNKVAKIYQAKKVGHTGTLDPLATGLLIVCIGKYTKLVESLTNKQKEYVAVMHLGQKTDTGDITGKVIEEKKVSLSDEEIKKAFLDFPREYEQTVPIYSAVKIKGKKLYEYAREGQNVELPKRKVVIEELEFLKREGDRITFRTVVSKGTYIRSLIEDIASTLKTVATMEKLTRTRQGIYSLENCQDLENITSQTPLLKLENLFTYPKVEIDEETLKRVKNGNKIFIECSSPKILISYQEQVIALYEKDGNSYRYLFGE